MKAYVEIIMKKAACQNMRTTAAYRSRCTARATEAALRAVAERRRQRLKSIGKAGRRRAAFNRMKKGEGGRVRALQRLLSCGKITAARRGGGIENRKAALVKIRQRLEKSWRTSSENALQNLLALRLIYITCSNRKNTSSISCNLIANGSGGCWCGIGGDKSPRELIAAGSALGSGIALWKITAEGLQAHLRAPLNRCLRIQPSRRRVEGESRVFRGLRGGISTHGISRYYLANGRRNEGW